MLITKNFNLLFVNFYQQETNYLQTNAAREIVTGINLENQDQFHESELFHESAHQLCRTRLQFSLTLSEMFWWVRRDQKKTLKIHTFFHLTQVQFYQLRYWGLLSTWHRSLDQSPRRKYSTKIHPCVGFTRKTVSLANAITDKVIGSRTHWSWFKSEGTGWLRFQWFPDVASEVNTDRRRSVR